MLSEEIVRTVADRKLRTDFRARISHLKSGDQHESLPIFRVQHRLYGASCVLNRPIQREKSESTS